MIWCYPQTLSFMFLKLLLGCTRVFSSHGEQEPLSSFGAWASSCSVFSAGSQAPGSRAPVVAAHGLSCSSACGIFRDQGSNPCPCLGRWSLNHWTIREMQSFIMCLSCPLILGVSHHLGVVLIPQRTKQACSLAWWNFDQVN